MLTFDNGKNDCELLQIDAALDGARYFASPFASLERCCNETSTDFCDSTCPRCGRWSLHE